MKKMILSIAVALLSVTGAMAQLKDGKFNIDYKASTINWSAQKVTGSGHQGTIRVSSGQVVVAKGAVTSGKVKVDMNGMTCTDLTDAEMNANLINHLKSPDFFNTAAFPDANFEVVSVKAQADKSGNTHMVTGKFTIKGITKELSFPAKITGDEKQVIISGTMNLDRSLFDVKYGSSTFFESLGDKAINNEIKLTFNFVANKA